MRLSSYSTSRASRAILDSSNGKSPRKKFRSSNRQKRNQSLIHCQAIEADPETGTVSIPDAIPSSPLDSNWGSFREKLVTESGAFVPEEDWAHALSYPELGCLLLAHPLMFTKQQTHFKLGVIFLFVHGDEGSAGLILNKPTQFRIGDFVTSKEVANGFEDNTLFLGGDVGDNSLHLVHKFGDLEQSRKVIDGVYINGFDAAQRAVLEGTRKPSEFNWYTQFCGWHPGQLEEECKNGVWFPATCSKNLILKERCLMNSPIEDWHRIMQLIGGAHKDLSNAILTAYKSSPSSSAAADISGSSSSSDEQHLE
eukprot:g4046.t1